ncbi:hypothetical protein DICVIV_03746 [Dictyocaulus viviparus]|uniref:Uncharacterized protein n=1 Tax=Dictyocaulus viviparus TaxID=29172 RepID=A0A0D8Y233_DICVI|nr:hypothetical protein DICVIV_03746 [Dictyocaulus viviparus]
MSVVVEVAISDTLTFHMHCNNELDDANWNSSHSFGLLGSTDNITFQKRVFFFERVVAFYTWLGTKAVKKSGAHRKLRMMNRRSSSVAVKHSPWRFIIRVLTSDHSEPKDHRTCSLIEA